MGKNIKNNTSPKKILLIILLCVYTAFFILAAYLNFREGHIAFGVILILAAFTYGLAQTVTLYSSIKYKNASLMFFYDNSETLEYITAIIERSGYKQVESDDGRVIFRHKRLLINRGQINAEQHDFCVVLRGPKCILDTISSKFDNKFDWSDCNKY
jgi:hypothetical protein